jgi:hypothetical protein
MLEVRHLAFEGNDRLMTLRAPEGTLRKLSELLLEEVREFDANEAPLDVRHPKPPDKGLIVMPWRRQTSSSGWR